MSSTMASVGWLWALGGCAFGLGCAIVWTLQRSRAVQAHAIGARVQLAPPRARAAAQIVVRSFDEVVADTETRPLLDSIEHRMRLSQANFRADCLPVLQAFAEYVQFLPASESHHHAQPGGLWVHALEVLDAALAIRCGTEMPRGASTEERKRVEHRWSVGVFIAALLHDIGKPMADLRITLYGRDARQGQPWAAVAGTMRSAGGTHYSVDFAPPDARDYTLHQRLPAILMQQVVSQRVMRWLADDAVLMRDLLAYLAGESVDGALSEIVKRADSDSVRRNLLHGPRTRFATARTRPVIERLMDALRRMVRDGVSLPLNRSGAVGWVADDCVWFVCGRLADEVRNYLSEHESGQGIPGKDKNDRLFDVWQEYGAIIPNPDTGGAIWRVRVECDGWSPPDALTVLRFPLSALFEAGDPLPSAMNGRIVPVTKGSGAPVAQNAPVFAPIRTPVPSNVPVAHAASVQPRTSPPTPRKPAPVVPAPASTPVASGFDVSEPLPDPTVADAESTAFADPENEDLPPDAVGLVDAWRADDDASRSVRPEAQLDRIDSARVEPAVQRTEATAEVSQPLKPYDKKRKHPAPAKDAPPLAKAFMAWVAQCVNTGEIKYNEDGALVHFVPEGALLFSPEIFKRFVAEHETVTDGPVREFLAEHGDRAYAKLQNELSKSGYTRRNGDENLHYYCFTKGGGGVSRVAAYYLIGHPELFWRPVPPPNSRIQRAERPAKKLPLPLPAAPTASETKPRKHHGLPA